MSKWLHFEVLKNVFEPNDYFSFSAFRQSWVLSIKHCSFVGSGHDFTMITFMIALFQWNLARPAFFFFFFFSISTSSEGNAVREMQEFTAWTNKEAKLLQRCHYYKMQWLERAWRLALFLERVVFPDRGVAVASQSVLKLPEKKRTHFRATRSLLSLSLYIFSYNHPSCSCGIAVITTRMRLALRSTFATQRR